MELLLASQVKGEEMPEDDPQMSYMISAWARICKILGSGFAPYLPLVMGPVMKTASMKPEVTLLDNDELTGVEEETEVGAIFENLGLPATWVLSSSRLMRFHYGIERNFVCSWRRPNCRSQITDLSFFCPDFLIMKSIVRFSNNLNLHAIISTPLIIDLH
jgi:hypothetical protein